MQNKGVIKIIAILIAIACIWQLSFSVVTSYQEKKADKYAQKMADEFEKSEAFKKINKEDRAFAIDSLMKFKKRWFIDSISNKKIYFGYTFKDVQAKEINLGLDLKGGMNVVLQVQLQDLVNALSGYSQDPDFKKALALAEKNNTDSREDFITRFANAWKTVAGNKPLINIFPSFEMNNRLKNGASNAEVIKLLREDANSAVSNSLNVLRTRIDRFGVTQPSIQELGNSGRILVEMPGIKDPKRIEKLLQGTASLEFWETYTNQQLQSQLQQANQLIKEMIQNNDSQVAIAKREAKESVKKTESRDSSLLNKIISANDNSISDAQARKENPLFSVLIPNPNTNSACIGYARGIDTALVNKYLNIPRVKELFFKDFIPMWSVKPSRYFQGGKGNYYELIAIRARNGKAPIDGDAVTDARVSYSGMGSRRSANPTVSMTMNVQGATTWAHMTKDNIGRQIAIVLDGLVYSDPVVNQEITGGSTEISGNFTVDEAKDLANVLKSGKLPVPARIVQEQVVGPSLGARSIRAGMISFIIAFILVLCYMLFFYNGAGLVANIALLGNVLFLFGVLTSFGAVLTLPGIAGLVLTLGMAVDANVIIYERIKEELAAGKGLSKAVADGYSNAYSAIIDGQVTTLLTGIVLFYFGSGPVQGFATVLIIGIITSVLTSIFITRIIIDDRVEAGKSISFENSFSKNFLKNTNVDFLSLRKFSYAFSGTLIIISLLSIGIKGFSYGVDFTGGRTYIVRFDQPVTAEQVRKAAEKEFKGSVEVKQFGGDSQMKITTKYLANNETAKADSIIVGMLYKATKPFFANKSMSLNEFKSTQDNPNGIISSDMVGPTIANDVKRDAIFSVILSLLVIFLYIAFRFRHWTWGLGGVLSLTHTAIIVIGFFSLFTGILPFNLDVDQTFIAAILTIIGYAINDNVVIFDRIREHNMLHPKNPFKDTVNTALNATLTRTVNTSASTLVTMLAIAVFGGESIRGLAVALVIGIIVGTYASIFIGTPIMYDTTKMMEKKDSKKLSQAKA